METETENPSGNKSRQGKIFRRVLGLAALGVLLLIALLAGLVGYDLSRPLAPPASRSLGPLDDKIPLTGVEPKTTLPSSIAPQPVAVSDTASTPSRQMAGEPGKPPPREAAVLLLPEAAQPNPDLKAKARAINEEFARLRSEFGLYLGFKKRRSDPDVPIMQEAEARAQVYQSYEKIIARLRSDFGREYVQRFDELFLGMLMEHEDWTEALKYCVERRNDWDGGFYCARQMGKFEGGVMTAVLSGMRIYFKAQGHPPQP